MEEYTLPVQFSSKIDNDAVRQEKNPTVEGWGGRSCGVTETVGSARAAAPAPQNLR